MTIDYTTTNHNKQTTTDWKILKSLSFVNIIAQNARKS